MKNCLLYFFLTVTSLSIFAQPDSACAVIINPQDSSIVSSLSRRSWQMAKTYYPLNIDGIKDAAWDCFFSHNIDRYVMHQTVYEGGIYSGKAYPDRRLPDYAADFSGDYRITYDDDYIYLLYDIVDNEVNDSVINPGITEQIDLFIAPYADSVQQSLNGNPYPPYTGICPEINKKYAYWTYLGAFHIIFNLVKDGKCNIKIKEREDADKINYKLRAQACKCAWKLRDDGTGYKAEIAVSAKITLADSVYNPYRFPDNKEVKFMAFDLTLIDRDEGLKNVVASWNAQDGNMEDAMLYTGKLIFDHWWPNCKVEDTFVTLPDKTQFYPTTVSNVITFSQKVTKAEIYSITGVLMKSEQNTEQLNVSDLPQGLYVVKADGVVIGKMVKE